MKALLQKIRRILKDRRTRQMLTRIISVTAAVVVFVTTYALVLPAITMETEAQCGIEAHQHSDECYTDELVCEIPESPGHVHTGACYELSQVLVCETPEHEHSVENGCYDEDGNLICELTEHHHTVDDGCYKETKELVCDIPESEGHTHDSSCYKKVLTCGKEVHTHSTSCYHIDAASKAATEAAAVASTESSAIAGTESMMSTKASTTSEVTAFTDNLPGDEIDESNIGTIGTATSADTENADTTSADANAAGADLGVESGTWTPAEETVDSTATETDSGATGSTTSAAPSSATSSTSSTASTTEKATEENAGYVPVLDELNINAVLNDHTGIYYYHPESDSATDSNEASTEDSVGAVKTDNNDNNVAEDANEDSAYAVTDGSAISAEDWHRIPNNTEHGEIPELGESDLLRVYLAYTIPAGSLNETNTVTRYRLPGNIRLSDDQIDTINSTVNGIAAQYVNMDTLEILDVDQYNASLGIEAVEGTRTPDQDIQAYLNDLEKSGEEASEYINATVRIENVFNEDTGDYEGQDLVFTFTPYSILKNRHEYDKDGQPTKAGESLEGWVSFDVTTDQIEWVYTENENDEVIIEKTSGIMFIEEDRELDIDAIRTDLRLVERTDVNDVQADNAAEKEDTADADEAAVDNDQDASQAAESIEDAEDSGADGNTVRYPAVSFNDSITVSAGSLSTDTALTGIEESTEITVNVEADENTFPEGTTMRLAAVTDDQMDAVTEAVEGAMAEAAEAGVANGGHTQGFHAVDISFWNADGVEIEPLKPIRVSMTSESIKRAVEAEATAPVVVHVEDGSMSSEDASAKDITVDSTSTDTLTFEAGSFSVYAIVYTVDFHWEVNGKTYEFSIPGGGFVTLQQLVEVLGIANSDTDSENASNDAGNSGYFSVEAINLNSVTVSEAAKQFVADVASVEFSSPELVWIGNVGETSTVGALKSANGLDVQYSADLTEEQIEEINSSTIEGGDWALISMFPFDTEETMTVTMKNGDQFVVNVTDAQEIADASASTIDINKSYLICYEADGQYYLLKNDGSVDSTHNPSTFENLNSNYCWTFNYVFEEKHLEETLTYVYYLIRPIDNKTRTIALNAVGESLIQRSNNNVAVVSAEGGGFKLIGYNNIRMNFDNGQFLAAEFPDDEPDDGITVHIWEMDTLPTYSYTAYSADESRGSVEISGGTPKTEIIENDEGEGSQTIHYYEAESDSDKVNAGTITAIPVAHTDGDGDNKWVFDHWTQDGLPLDRNHYPAEISAETLPIPFNGSKLIAYFKQNPRYDVPPGEKEPSKFEDLQDWIDSLQTNPVPLDNEQTVKTSEVYDYENRIYRVDITSKSNFRTFNGNVDMAFCMDVSNSMYFPSALKETTASNYNNGNPDIPIYQINNSGRGWSNQGWLNTSRGYDNPYYLVADQANTATVFKIYYKGGEWRAIDASRENDNDSTKWFKIGNNFRTNWTASQYDDGTNMNHPFNAGDNNNTIYTIYDWAPDEQGIKRNRFYYLNQALSSATTDLTTIKDILAVAGDESPDVRVAYNTFNANLGSQRQDFQSVNPITGIDLSHSHAGGTRPDQAFIDAQTFDWQGDDRYIILITDGAPQGKREDDDFDNDFDHISAYVEEQAGILKNYGGVKFITIGLGLDKVPHGKQLLYDLADNDKNGEKMFYLAEDASDLPNILRQVVHTIMDESIVIADVTDTVGEAFYAVDRITGLPLTDGDMIDIEGCRTTDSDLAVGAIEIVDGVTTIKWTDQAIDSQIGWHGTVFVKAKEELLGGNALETNGGAEVRATKYRMDSGEYSFDGSLIDDKLKSLEVSFDSPRVNVNELSFPETHSEWTVYKGTEVDPKAQLKKMYEDVLVGKVVNEDGSLHYPLAPNNIADNREGQVVGDAAAFNLADAILECLKATAGSDNDLAALYVQDDELNWDAFLAAILEPGGVKVPYHLFGTEGEDSAITIKLTKQILTGEQDDLINHSPHNTTVANDGNTPAEKYTLTVRYDPDYDHVLPSGQGGKPNGNHNYNFNTGTYGAMYQGHAAGREESLSEHTINVYEVPLDVYKTDGGSNPLAGATFKLYREDEEDGVAVEGLDSTKKYVEVAAATSGDNGVARLKHDGKDFGLVLGETYYLIESAAPENYTRVSTVWAVEVQTEIGKFTNLNGEAIYSRINPDPDATPPVTAGTGVTDDMYPFNWDQGARIMLDGKDPVLVIAKGETEGTTAEITDGSFVSHEKAVAFRHTVVNLSGNIDITVNKTWEDENDPPESVKVKLYRVSEKGHVWGNGKVVPCTCTSKGNKEYTCSVCGKTETFVIDKAGHKAGTAHRENETAATCTEAGGYDTVVRCMYCNAIISSEHTDIPATEHTWVNQETATTDPENYCYDTVDICSLCGETNEESRVHHEHDWGEWDETTPAGINVTGAKKRVCRHDPTHIQNETIDPLPATVTIYFRYQQNGGGCGGFSVPQTITTRTGTGLGDMTIKWNWDQYTSPANLTFGVEGLGTSTYTPTSSGNYNGAEQTLTIHNITTNLTLYVTIRNNGYAGTSNDLIGQPTFSGTPNRSVSADSLLSVSSVRKQLAVPGLVLMASEPLRDSVSPAAMAAEELTAYLDSLKTKDEASCADNADHLYKEYVDEFTISGDSWTLDIPDLPKYNEYGNEYAYYVAEDPVLTGYEVTYTGQETGLHDEGEVTINNKKAIGSLKITKNVSVPTGLSSSLANGTYSFEIWNADGSAQITKRADGTDIGALQITVTDGVASPAELTVDNLKAGSYVVKETASTNSATIIDTSVPGYNAELGGIAVTVTAGDTLVPTAAFTNKYETVNATVKKVWVDDNNSESVRPSALTVTLVADGEVTAHTVTLSESNHWEDTISNLPKYKDSVEIDYHWLEGEMPDGYFLTSVAKNGTITTLTNTLSKYDLKTSYTGIKSWSDEANKYSTRPHELIVTLYADDAALSVEPVWNYDYAGNQWSYTFENLPVFTDDGTLIHYTAQETVPYGYLKTDESQTPTTGQFGTIMYEDGRDRTTPNNTIEWQLGSLIDLAFVAIKPTANGDVVVWTHRVPLPAERTAITNAIKGGALPGCAGRNIVFYSGTGDVYTPHGNVHVTYDQAALGVTLDFGSTDVWSQFIVGQFNKNDSSSYNVGTTAFTNTLETTELNGTKKWNIEGDEIPANPILILTRTITTTEGEGGDAVTTTSSPEVVKVMQGGTQVNNQPEWSGTGKNRSFSYTSLPKYDPQGNEYTYSVSEASFTVGSGADAVTYTAVKAADGTYTVTASKAGATVYTVTQTGNDIMNGLVEAEIEIVKVEKGHKDSSHTLSGAKFRLTRVNEDNDNNYSGEGAYQSDVQTVDPETGKTIFTGLRPGRYKLEETEAPAGYILVESPWYFIIDGTGLAVLQPGHSYDQASAVIGGDNSFWIENIPGAMLPNSGGHGTNWIYLLGITLIGLAGAGYVMKSRRRKME